VQPSAFENRQSPAVSSIPGLHIVANFQVADLHKITSFSPFKKFIESQILKHNLCSVGEVFHDFPMGGFTGVVCLTESHLSIHTWPENNYVTFDIFLSNYLKDNRAITQLLYDSVQKYLNATVLFEQIIDR
jgi:S-adenosylmethionine decarboxylase